MQLSVFMAGRDFSRKVEMASLRIEQDIDGLANTASFRLIDREDTIVGLQLQPHDVALEEIDICSDGPVVSDYTYVATDTLVGDPVCLFSGQVARITRLFPDPSMEQWEIAGTSWESEIDKVVMNTAYTLGPTDQGLVQNAFAKYYPAVSAPDATVQIVGHPGEINAIGLTLREFMNRVAATTGARWYIGTNKTLYYFAGGANPAVAPFDVDLDAPSPPGSLALPITIGTEDYLQIANRVTVYGAGSVVGTANDTTSQGIYGIRHRTITDTSITASAQAQNRAQAEVAAWAFPLRSGRFTTWADGLMAGQDIDIKSTRLGLSGPYIIRRMAITQETRTRTRYDVEFVGQVI